MCVSFLGTSSWQPTDQAVGRNATVTPCTSLAISIRPFNAVSAAVPHLCLARLATEFPQVPSGSRPECLRLWGGFLFPYSSDPRPSFVLSPSLGVSSGAPVCTESQLRPMGPGDALSDPKARRRSGNQTRLSIRWCAWSYIYDAHCSRRNNARRGRWDIYTDRGSRLRPGCLRLLSMPTYGELWGRPRFCATVDVSVESGKIRQETMFCSSVLQCPVMSFEPNPTFGEGRHRASRTSPCAASTSIASFGQSELE